MRIADELQVDCPVFYIDNVAEYVAARGSVNTDELPPCAPPFERWWMEFAFLREKEGIRRLGVFFHAREVTPDEREASDTHQAYRRAKWVVGTEIYWRNPNYNGGALSRSQSSHYVVLSDEDPPIIAGKDPRAGLLAYSLVALAFMQCRNVRHVEHRPKLASGKGWKQTKSPTLTYYTLEIDPMKETLRREGNVETVGLARAFHICRAHFKDYRQSGLFGKIKGIFWWGPALRGSPEHGQVVKDYAVKAPDAPPHNETVH